MLLSLCLQIKQLVYVSTKSIIYFVGKVACLRDQGRIIESIGYVLLQYIMVSPSGLEPETGP